MGENRGMLSTYERRSGSVKPKRSGSRKMLLSERKARSKILKHVEQVDGLMNL
jgi:hypothetical protein